MLWSGLGLRTPYGGLEHPQPQVPYTLVELLREDGIPVMDEEAVAMVTRDGFAELLQCPVGCRMCSHIAMQDTAGGVFHDTKTRRKAVVTTR
jgi:hypothetical protein